MKIKPLLLVFAVMSLAHAAAARDEQSTFNATASHRARTQWNTDPKYWERVLREPKEFSDLQIGRSDYMVSGPLVEGLRRRRSSPDLSLGKRLLRLPVVRLLVPLPMASPPGGGRYFLWGESSRPWTMVAEGAVAGDLSNPMTHEARSLISISR